MTSLEPGVLIIVALDPLEVHAFFVLVVVLSHDGLLEVVKVKDQYCFAPVIPRVAQPVPRTVPPIAFFTTPPAL
jgi:hypothetical protein